MATIFRVRRTAEPQSGGKVMRGRRIAAARTPYERPSLEPPASENPSWLISTTRMIASGAGKLISSVFGSDSSSSSSPSSSASSGEESSAEDNADEDNNDMNTSSHRAAKLTKNGGATEIIQSFRKEPQLSVGKSETKYLIEQLLMQETFSREECDRLIEIIRSRAISCPTAEDGTCRRLSKHPDRIFDSDGPMPDLRAAVMEAKKWLEEKKSGSSLKSGLHHEACTLNSVMLPHVKEGEASPVDMAKTYMRTRPPWASPSMSNGLSTPSPIGVHLFKEDTPYALGHNTLSSSKKRDGFATGSWNIREEIRRVRAKATEDMLSSSPTMKTNLSEFGHKTNQTSLVSDRTGVGLGDKMDYSSSLAALKSIDASSNLASELATGLVSAVSDATQDGSRIGAPSLDPTISVCGQNQVGEVGAASNSHQAIAVEAASELWNEEMLNCGVELLHSPEGVITMLQNCQTIDGGAGPKDNSHDQQFNTVMDSNVEAARLNDGNCLTPKDGAVSDGDPIINGFASELSLPVPANAEQTPIPDEELNPIITIHDEIADAHGGEVACELLSEVFMEVPIVNETETDSPQNSLGLHHEELADDPRKQNSKRSLSGRGNMGGKQQGKKLTRYNRRGRGRGM